MRQRYPFDALQRLRQERVEQRAAALGESAAESARARAAEARARAVREDAQRKIEEAAQRERKSLERGELRATDLQTQGEWQKRAELELEAKKKLELEAEHTALAKAEAEREARRALGGASTEARVVETHRGAFEAGLFLAEERSEEEAATEQWTASRFSQRS